jgi:hypothetical protein
VARVTKALRQRLRLSGLDRLRRVRLRQEEQDELQLKNKDGNFVSPDDDSFKAAAAGDWAKTPGFALTDRPAGKNRGRSPAPPSS